MQEMKVKAVTPWFGSNRMLAASVGEALGRRAWVGIPFTGGCCEIPYIQTRAGVANDLHRHQINLCRVVADVILADRLYLSLEDKLFHPDELAAAQARCAERDARFEDSLWIEKDDPCPEPDWEWARDYFVACWMAASANAGTAKEFGGYYPVRWTSSGGGSARRFRSATESIKAWTIAFRGWEFVCEDCFVFLDRVQDQPGHGVYSDPPWVGAGDAYRHRFTLDHHRRLATAHSRFKHAKIVIRYGDDPAIRELYPEDQWTWITQTSRDQANGVVAEVLITSKESTDVHASRSE